MQIFFSTLVCGGGFVLQALLTAKIIKRHAGFSRRLLLNYMECLL